MNLRGTILEIGLTKKTFKSHVRNFILSVEVETKTAGNFTNEFNLTLTSDRVTELDRFKVGEKVDVSVNLGASKYVDRDTGNVTRYNLLLVRTILRVGGRPTEFNPIGQTRAQSKSDLI